MQLKVDGQIIKRIDKAQAVADSIKYLQVEFEFSEAWQGVVKTVITKSYNKSTVYTQLMADDDTYIIPADLIKSPGFWLTVLGNLGDVQITANDFRVDVVASGLADGSAPPEPEPTLFEQLMGEFSQAKTETEANAELAAASATLAESYAQGGTDSREGEDIDNAKYYKEQAELAADSIGNAVELSGQAAQMAVEAKNTAVIAKDAAVNAKGEAEAAKETAVQAKSAAENAKLGAETAKEDAEDFKTAAETAKGEAATAKTGAEAAKTAAETARGLAETAKAEAEAARNAAQLAKVDAETAERNAEAIIASGEAQLQAVTDEGIKQVGKVTSEGNKQVGLVAAAGSDQVGKVNAAGDNQFERVESAGSARLAEVNAAGATQVENVVSTANSKIAVMAEKEAAATEEAVLAKSYAVGGTGTRPGEDTDNAKYYKEAASEIVGGDYATRSEAQGYASEAEANAKAASVPLNQKGVAGGVASLDGSGKVPSGQLPAMDYDPAGSAAAVDGKLTTHVNNKLNPHGVTAAQVGARPNTWMPTAAEVGAETPSGAQAKANTAEANAKAASDPVGSAATVDGKLTTHVNDGVKHITAAERSTWNGKETTSGAQTKANAAEANAKAYADSLLGNVETMLDNINGEVI